MQKITPFLWFDGKAEEAVNFYVSIFDKAKIGDVSRYDDVSSKASGQPEGKVMTIEFQIEGEDFVAINGGPEFKFTPAVSFMVYCDTQEKIDKLWDKLSDGGKPMQCGWVTDKYGVSWQITPTVLMEIIREKDPVKYKRVMEAMLKMEKLDIKTLKQAYES